MLAELSPIGSRARAACDSRRAQSGSRSDGSLISSSGGTLESGKDALGVLVVDLLQDVGRQLQAVDVPQALPRVAEVLEVFVRGLQPSEVVAIHRRGWL